MYIGYRNHHCYEKTILVHNNMTFDSFHFLITVNSIQKLVITPFNTLTIYYT